MTEPRQKVLVLGSDMRSFLTVIRSLGRAGKEVHVAWSSRDSLAATSKYVARIHRPTRPPSSGWREEFKSLLEQEQFDLVIPCNDPSILPLHQERDYFSAYPIYLVVERIFETVMDKAAVNEVARQASLRLPREVTIQSEDAFSKLEGLNPPYVLKPTQSYVTSRLSQKNQVRIAPNLETARQSLKQMLAKTPVAVQEYFAGTGVGVEFIAEEGKILTAFQHRRLHEPPSGGGSSHRISCPLNPDLLRETNALVEALGYTGVGMAEFRFDFKRNDWIFVELNSRFWGSLPLAVNCGMDFPAYLFDLCCTGRRDFPTEYRQHRVCRNWLRDMHWLRDTIASNRLSIPGHAKMAWQLAKELRYPLTLRESSDTLAWDDPGPGLNEVKQTCAEVPRRIYRKAARAITGLGPVQSWTRKRLLRKLATARQVAFVCKGNICRSPFAENYVHAKFGDSLQVDSYGYFPKTGRPSPENAVAAASQFGVDLSKHRSQVLSSEAVDRADLILVFDEENHTTVRSQFPRARSKTFMLGLLQPNPTLEIVDPYGGTVEDFRSIYSRISDSLKDWPVELDQAFDPEAAELGT